MDFKVSSANLRRFLATLLILKLKTNQSNYWVVFKNLLGLVIDEEKKNQVHLCGMDNTKPFTM